MNNTQQTDTNVQSLSRIDLTSNGYLAERTTTLWSGLIRIFAVHEMNSYQTKIKHQSSMGRMWRKTYLPPPKYPDSLCSEAGCFNKCVSTDGHRIRTPHKARCCAVCSNWYCGEHKTKSLLYTDIYPQTCCSKTDIHQEVYKCRKGNCLQMYGVHTS
eukprot:371210_1